MTFRKLNYDNHCFEPNYIYKRQKAVFTVVKFPRCGVFKVKEAKQNELHVTGLWRCYNI